jgi:selenocysteine-specific elongation factor
MTQAMTFGVIGHVDHGKTALVRTLTGIETDRLKEEQERGLSILLGFAYLETPNGVIDLIDVPGHEDFIRAMVSGATGLDGAVLVVAANEGVMPQTREHFDIARLLELDRGLIVVNKADLVSGEALAAVCDSIRTFVRGSFLEGAPIIAVSTATGQGIDDLRGALNDLAAAPIPRPAGRAFYLPLDRAFTMRGFGVVATGTLRGGRLRVNDRVEILPGGRFATVRALQSRRRAIDEAVPGQRVAVNLRNVDRNELARGDTLATPGSLTASRRIDVQLKLLENDAPMVQKGLANGAPVRLLIGTTEAVATVRLLDRQSLEPGATALAQLHCDRDLATHESERFVIRSYSPMTTIGGGQILDAHPKRHRRFDATVVRRLETAAAGDSAAMLKQLVAEAGVRGVDVAAAAQQLQLAPDAVRAAAAQMDALVIAERLLVPRASFAELLDRILADVAQHHREQPHQPGVAGARVRSRLPTEPHDDVFRRAVADLVASGKLRNDGERLALAEFDILGGLSAGERAAAAELERGFLKHGLEAPPVEAVVGRDKQKVYRLLVETGRLVRLKTYERDAPQLVLHADTLEDIKRRLRECYPYPATFALKDVRDLLQSTRKYVLPLMEHFDATGFTQRRGDLRQLRER